MCVPTQPLYGFSCDPERICPMKLSQQKRKCTRPITRRQRNAGRVAGGGVGLSDVQGAEILPNHGSSICGSQERCWWLKNENIGES